MFKINVSKIKSFDKVFIPAKLMDYPCHKSGTKNTYEYRLYAGLDRSPEPRFTACCIEADRMNEKAELERCAVLRLAELAALPLDMESVESCSPPEPDVHVKRHSGEFVSFEVTEICNSKNPQFLFSAPIIASIIEEAIESLPHKRQRRFHQRFTNHPLQFTFRGDVSKSKIQGAISWVLEELIEMEEVECTFSSFTSKQAKSIIAHVKSVGNLCNYNGINFSIGGFFNSYAPVVETVEAKLVKRYETTSPIELLAYYGAHAYPSDPSTWRTTLKLILDKRGCGPFQRVWVMDWKEVSFVYP